MNGFFEGGLLCLEGNTMGARGSMPLVYEVILTEDTIPAPPFSIPSPTGPSVKIWKSAGGMDARVRSESSLCLDADIPLSTGVITVWIGGGFSNRGKLLTGGGVGAKTWG